MDLIGKYAYVVDSCLAWKGSHGYLISANVHNDEYEVAGGAFSALNPDGTIDGSVPMLCRSDFTIRGKQPEDKADFEAWLRARSKIVQPES